MQQVLNVKQIREADSIAIEEYGIAGDLLMENAARSAAEYILEILADSSAEIGLVDIICGSGNNGGDGFALARHLFEELPVRVLWIGNEDKMSPETLRNFKSVQKFDIDCLHIESDEILNTIQFSTECIIDSMIGVGGSENIKGIANEILKILKTNYALKIAIDSPTGLNADTGITSENCFRADYTITMFAPKAGFYLNEGPDYCGEILTAYLGAPQSIVDFISEISILEEKDLAELIPVRNKRTSKFDYGRVMIIAGSERFSGAACLTANAAISSGAGLVELYSTSLHPSLLPEVIFQKLPMNEYGTINETAFGILKDDIYNSNVIAIGPGLSVNSSTIKFVRLLLEVIPDDKVIIIDADGLKAITKDSKLNKNIILTPHSGEFARLTGLDRIEIEKNPQEIVKEWAIKLNCNIVLKYHPVIITDGERSYWNITGNAGMATGGSGDVLTGIIAGLLAQGLEPLEASAVAVYIHAKAGDLYASHYNEESLTASELINYLPEAMSIR